MLSLTGDWTRDLPHSKPALYHYAIEEAVHIEWNKYSIWMVVTLITAMSVCSCCSLQGHLGFIKSFEFGFLQVPQASADIRAQKQALSL